MWTISQWLYFCDSNFVTNFLWQINSYRHSYSSNSDSSNSDSSNSDNSYSDSSNKDSSNSDSSNSTVVFSL